MNLAVLTVVLVAAVSLTVTLMFLVRRAARIDEFLTNTTRGSAIFGMVGSAFAVLLAFVVFVAFQSYNNAKTGAESEAVAVLELFRTAGFFPASQRDRLEAEAACYARAVVGQWSMMRDGGRSRVVDGWVLRLNATLRALEPGTEREQAAFADLLREGDERTRGRRERLSQADPIVTSPVWFILALGGGVTILFVLLFTDRRESFVVQAGLMASVTAAVMAGLALIWFLDHPYADGSGSVKPVEMRRSLASMSDERAGLRLPCTSTGRPHRA